ncbi:MULTISPECIES: hypothetical protein [Microbacterium]|uniref:hypothetical protein n=1 Tax=Microbacterium TaxID=33882 RepID=UPI0006F24810|nr:MULTISPECIES: hypothetical protein [Microbacterium]KQR39785.1 hypothetical protein ASF80_10495 [Microbacterium sp. Leaf159]
MNGHTHVSATEDVHNRLRVWGSVAAVVALTATMVSPAHASETTDDADAIASLIQEAAPATDLSEPGDLVAGELSTEAGDVQSIVPLSAEEAITVTSANGAGEQTATIDLPDEIDVKDGVVADDGTVVFAATDDSGDAVAVQTLDDGSTRIQTVIGGSASAHEFGYRMSGYQPYQSDTGEVIFVSEDGNYVPVAAPWATDANGNPVETRYEIRGDELFQIVVADDSTSYPVVADPSWQWYGPIWGMKLTRAETSRVRDYAAALGMCAVFARQVSIACSAFGSYIILQANLAQGDSPAKTCLFFTAAPVPGVIFRLGC